jgi:hypothetical protein
VQLALATTAPAAPARPQAVAAAGPPALREQSAEARAAVAPDRRHGERVARARRLHRDRAHRAGDRPHAPDRGLRSRVTGDALVRLGERPFVDVDLAARPLALATVGRFAPAAGLRGVATGPIRARGTLRDLFVDSRLAVSGGGEIAARGRLDLESAETGTTSRSTRGCSTRAR